MELKKIREANNMTQSELAERINVTQGVISMWEIGLCNPGLDNVMKLAQTLHCSIDELLKDPNKEESNE